jgi:hypothetical protein
MSTSKIQCLTPFLKIYKWMKIIIIENLYPKLRIVNESIRYIENTSFTNSKWMQKYITMHPPINVLVNFNDFIEKKHKITRPLLKCCTNNVPKWRNFQYHHHILESNTFKTFIINKYQLPFAPTFCLTDFTKING